MKRSSQTIVKVVGVVLTLVALAAAGGAPSDFKPGRPSVATTVAGSN